MEIKGKVVTKMSNGKAFKLSDGKFYNVEDAIKSDLAKINNGDEVILEVEKKGVANIVKKITKATGAETKKDTEKPTGEFKCEECGATLKDGKYKKCYACNQKNPDTSNKDKIGYGSPEDIRGKQTGCALAAAASAAAGRQFINEKGEEDPEKAAQWIKIVADSLLDWMCNKNN
jgi:hypothetical protein